MPTVNTVPSGRRPVPLGVVAAVLVIGVLAAGGVIAWRVLAAEPDPNPEPSSPEEVLAEFYRAQEAGDCERLLSVLSEETWSDDGDRTREEFLEQCPDALEGYRRPDPEDSAGTGIELRREFDPVEQEDVYVVTTGPGTGRPHGDGRLIQEGGEWKIVADEHLLRIGPPPTAALRHYLRAYAAGDCEAIPDHVAEETWSDDGRLDRREYLERCAAAVDARSPSLDTEPSVASFGVNVEGGDRAVITARGDGGSFKVLMVKKGLRWMVLGEQVRGAPAKTYALPGAPAGTHLRVLRYRELADRLPSDPVIAGERCEDGLDIDDREPDVPKRLSGGASASRWYNGCELQVALYEFADAETARLAANHIAGRMLADGNHRLEVPGHPAAIGVESRPTGVVSVLRAHDNLLVVVVSHLGDTRQAAQMLSVQLGRL